MEIGIIHAMESIIKHIRDREYMSGVDREKNRVKATGEVFTPTPLVQEILDQLPQELFSDPTKTFLDPTCGDGQFLKKTQKLTRYSCGIEIQDDYVSELKKEVDIYKDLSEIKKKIDCFFPMVRVTVI